MIAGRTALITGAGNGLGHAITASLAAAGARVVMVGRDESRLRAAATRVDTSRGVRTATCDVSDPDSVARLDEAVRDEDISILVNNAGIPGPVKPLVDIGVDEWNEVFGTNVRGMFLMCRAFVPRMVTRGHGDVINLASVSGKRPLVNRTPYCASKMAVIGLTTTLATEVGKKGVNVNSLSPGPVRGERMGRIFQIQARQARTTPAEAERAFVGSSALGRLVEEEEVGEAVVAMLNMPGLCAADIDLSAGLAVR